MSFREFFIRRILDAADAKLSLASPQRRCGLTVEILRRFPSPWSSSPVDLSRVRILQAPIVPRSRQVYFSKISSDPLTLCTAAI